MKITKAQLKQIIKEELMVMLIEQPTPGAPRTVAGGSEWRTSIPDDPDPIGSLIDMYISTMKSEYADELPPAIAELANLATNRDYEGIRTNFNKMWTDLIQYHRDEKTELPKLIPSNFRSIDTIVRNL